MNRVRRKSAVLAQIVPIESQKAVTGGDVLLHGWPLQTSRETQISQEKPYYRQFKLDVILPPSGRARNERVDMTLIEIIGGDPFSFHPSSQGCGDRSLLPQRAFSIASSAKVIKEVFYVILRQALYRSILERGCVHMVSPCPACVPA
jgi:hypothetical protein